LADGPHSNYYNLLNLFAYGVYNDYKGWYFALCCNARELHSDLHFEKKLFYVTLMCSLLGDFVIFKVFACFRIWLLCFIVYQILV